MAAQRRFTPREEQYIARQRSGHLATSDAKGTPHVVPVCYAWDGTQFWIAIDEKPKHVAPMRLKRVRNILARKEASLVIDHYDDDWSRLGFVMVSGSAAVVSGSAPACGHALTLLRQRYPAYRAMGLESRPLITITPGTVTTWGALDPPNEPQRPPARSGGRGNDFLPLARERRSVRRYTSEPVPHALILHVLEAARWAPSPHGRQPWRFAVLTRDVAKQRLAKAMGTEWVRTLEMDGEPPDVVASRLARSHERIISAPAIIVPCLYIADLDHYPDTQRQRAEETMAIQSLGAAIQNLLLAAYAVGLDGGWMCAPLFCPEAVRDALELDSALIPHALITLGYAALDPVRRERRTLDELIAAYE